jgi:hypothetical protein
MMEPHAVEHARPELNPDSLEVAEGRDTAAGKSFEAWIQKYWEKKAAGEKSIGIEAEKLD